MSTQWRSIHLVVSFITLAVAVPWLSSAPVLAQSSGCPNGNDNGAPCFANNPDILGGEQAHNLLRTEDLALVKLTRNQSGSGDLIQWRLNTSISILATPSKLLQLPASGSPPVVAVGRMFNVGKDTIVTAQGNLYFMTIDEGRATSASDPGQSIDDLVMADFTGDGFADLFTVGTRAREEDTMRVVTAQDVNKPFALKFGQIPRRADPVVRIAVGDFNGDGRPEVAGIINNGGADSLGIYTVDPTTLAITRAAILPLNGAAISIAAGRFGALNNDQLVTLGRSPNGACCVVQAYDFDTGSLQPKPKGASDKLITTTSAMSRFFSSSFIPGFYQQVLSAAVVQQGSANRVSVGLLTFSRDGNLTPSLVGGIATPNLTFGCAHDIAAGNFRQKNPFDPEKDLYDPRLNFAVAGTDCGNNTKVQVFTVDPIVQGTSLTVTYTSPQTLTFNSGAIPAGTVFRLAAGDLQGRSIPVGPPQKIIIPGKLQPDTILGVPPMHVDWITPAGRRNDPRILNVSVFPDSYNTSYNFANNSDKKSSRKATTSFTRGVKASTQLSYSWGLPKISETSVTLNLALERKHDESIEKAYDTYQGKSVELTAKTRFDDLVAVTESRMNIYSYPVLGQCVDRPGAPALDNCPPGKAPLHVQFSGPDDVRYLELARGAGLEWYQPVHEPGQIFSYPGSLTQLRANQPQVPIGDKTESSLQLLSPANTFWDWQSDQQVSITWSQQEGATLSSGTSETFAFDKSLTVAHESKVFGFSGNARLDLNNSTATSTLGQASSTYSASTGVRLNRGLGSDTSRDSNYAYQGQSFIFGQLAPTGTLDNNVPPNVDVKAQGFLSVGYAANPLSKAPFPSGLFWTQAYTVAPDVALNHPERWQQSAGQVQFNCPIGFTSSFASPACTPDPDEKPDPLNVAAALFYRMKGLFVTPGKTTEGPTTDQVAQGETVTLQARVYNYSLKNMEAGTRVRVRFYAQPWSTDGQFLEDDKGAFVPAVFIKEVELPPIPAFCGGVQGTTDPCATGTAPRNWALAKTEWDTSEVPADTYWKFWVVVWMEKNGQKVDEIQDHGLLAIPVQDLNSLADVPVQTYSNNLGVYNQVFYVGPKAGALQASAGSKQLKSKWENLPKGGVLGADQVLTLGASHDVVGADVDNVMVLFYDGDPEQGGELFDMELIPHIAANESFVSRVSYSPGVCGTHQLFVQAIPLDGATPMTTDVSAVTVECPEPSLSLTNVQGDAENVGSGSSSGTLQLSGKVVGVSIPDLSTTTLGLLDLLRESAGAGELVRKSFGPLLPFQLTARTGSNAKTAIFETTPAITTPKVRVEITQSNPNIAELDFSAQIEGAVIQAPQGCGTAANGTVPLQTRFTLTSQARGPVEINTEQTWQCNGNQLKTP